MIWFCNWPIKLELCSFSHQSDFVSGSGKEIDKLKIKRDKERERERESKSEYRVILNGKVGG